MNKNLAYAFTPVPTAIKHKKVVVPSTNRGQMVNRSYTRMRTPMKDNLRMTAEQPNSAANVDMSALKDQTTTEGFAIQPDTVT